MTPADLVLALIPPQYLVYIGAIVGMCMILTAAKSAPTEPPWLVKVWGVMNFIAFNFGHAKNVNAEPPAPK